MRGDVAALREPVAEAEPRDEQNLEREIQIGNQSARAEYFRLSYPGGPDRNDRGSRAGDQGAPERVTEPSDAEGRDEDASLPPTGSILAACRT